MLREYPREPFLGAIAEAAQYGLYDLDRVERMILRRVQRDFFLLEDTTNDRRTRTAVQQSQAAPHARGLSTNNCRPPKSNRSLIPISSPDCCARNGATGRKCARMAHPPSVPAGTLVAGNVSFAKQPGVNRKQIRAFAELDFVAKRENLVFIGPTGVGKTGLACGILLKALQNGLRCQFIRAQDLFDEMYASLADRSTRRLVNRLARLDVF